MIIFVAKLPSQSCFCAFLVLISQRDLSFLLFFLISLTTGTFNLARPVVNTGIVLWIQQFYAMFVKRFYNSIRFWASVIWQLIIPLFFVLWGLILGKTIPGINSDSPSRVLTLENSALSENITFFYAQFGSGYPIVFDVSSKMFLSLVLSLTVSLYLSVSLCLPLSVCLSLSSLSLSLYLYLSLCLSLSLSVYFCLSLSLFVSLFLSLI